MHRTLSDTTISPLPSTQEIHYLLGFDGVPQDLIQILSNAEVREELEGHMNKIVVSAQHHGAIYRALDTIILYLNLKRRLNFNLKLKADAGALYSFFISCCS